MTEIKNRELKPVPGIEYSEIMVPDEQDLGTGTFTTELEPNAMAKINPIISSIINEPAFKLLVVINLAIESVTVLLGKADDSPPVSRTVYNLPKSLKTSDVNIFNVIFKSWEIKGLEMNGNSLEKTPAD